MDQRGELRRKHEALSDRWGDEDAPYVVFEDVFVQRFLVPLLLRGDDHATIARAFDLIERMSNSDDRRVRDLVDVAILEGLRTDCWELAKEAMGPATLRAAEVVQK